MSTPTMQRMETLLIETRLPALRAAFYPRSVTVIGATERQGSVGRTVVANLIAERAQHKGVPFEIYPVNPTRKECLGLPCFASIEALPGAPDLALIVTPAATVPGVMKQLGARGTGTAVVISAGFKELGEEGLALENRVVEAAREHDVRLIGPNCLGIMNPVHNLNATFAACAPIKGSIAFMSQSGAMCTAVLDWSMREKIGFSAFVSVGSMADVHWGDLINFLGNDPHTKSILIYMETIGSAKAFLSAARRVATNKPIIVIKAGRTEAAAAAAASHTGSLAGSHDAFLAAMRRVGVLVVDTISELFDCALLLGKQPRPKGPNLMIVTNAGGPGVLSTDAAVTFGATMAKLEPKEISALNAFLPPAWSHGNPVDVLGDAKPQAYARTLRTCLEANGADGVLVILSPQSVTEPTATAQALIDAIKEYKGPAKPILASWMGGKEVSKGFQLLNEAGIPTYAHPDAAAKTFSLIWKQSADLASTVECPTIDTRPFVDRKARTQCEGIIATARKENRTLLTEAESKQVLMPFGIPIADAIVCRSPEEAIAAANKTGFPCVLKLHSSTVTHKSDVGGVKLNIGNTDSLREAYAEIVESVTQAVGVDAIQGITVQPMINLSDGVELIMGSVTDSQFGPLVLFGSGGCYVEIFNDTVLSIPPLNATLAQRTLEYTKVFKALKGGHGERFPGADVDKLIGLLVDFSHLVAEMTDVIAEIEINPLLALPDRLVALDCRVILREDTAPHAELAIRPYPRDYIYPNRKTKDGEVFTIRPAHQNDAAAFKDFHRALSEKSIRQRYQSEMSIEERLRDSHIMSVCFADYNTFIPLIAEMPKRNEIAGICRLTRHATDASGAELMVAVCDKHQNRGIGKELMNVAMEVARREKMSYLDTSVVAEDGGGIMSLLKRHGWKVGKSSDPLVYACRISL